VGAYASQQRFETGERPNSLATTRVCKDSSWTGGSKRPCGEAAVGALETPKNPTMAQQFAPPRISFQCLARITEKLNPPNERHKGMSFRISSRSSAYSCGMTSS
jgi:hypothetical protein